jgi:hypothetical protein
MFVLGNYRCDMHCVVRAQKKPFPPEPSPGLFDLACSTVMVDDRLDALELLALSDLSDGDQDVADVVTKHEASKTEDDLHFDAVFGVVDAEDLGDADLAEDQDDEDESSKNSSGRGDAGSGQAGLSIFDVTKLQNVMFDFPLTNCRDLVLCFPGYKIMAPCSQ